MAGETTGQINPKLVTAFVKSTKNVLSTMAGIEAQLGKPGLKHEPTPAYDVSGIVGFTGEVMGSVVVSFRKSTAVSLVKAFSGEEMDVKSDDFADAIGELCNMIAGNAKKEFGLVAGIGIPSVIIGPGHTVARLRDVPCIVIPCTCEVGDFAVEVNIKQVVCVGVGGQ
jgi:chemotaxis protein CheX